jgi:predicted Zn-dependent protease
MFERLIRAAEGFSELGMHDEALAQLDELAEEQQDRVEAIRMRIDILLRKQEWQSALRLSLRMCEIHSKENYGYIHAAFCLHEVGRTLDAKQTLLDGPPGLLDEPVYYYNLACYDAALGNLDQARAYLRASFQLDKSLRELAKKDPDLAIIRDAM